MKKQTLRLSYIYLSIVFRFSRLYISAVLLDLLDFQKWQILACLSAGASITIRAQFIGVLRTTVFTIMTSSAKKHSEHNVSTCFNKTRPQRAWQPTSLKWLVNVVIDDRLESVLKTNGGKTPLLRNIVYFQGVHMSFSSPCPSGIQRTGLLLKVTLSFSSSTNPKGF